VSFPVLRGVVMVICVAGIAGMIVGTLATDNNNGVVVTFGMITAVSVLALMAATSAVMRMGGGTVDETVAAAVEARVQRLVDAGAPETDVRALVGDAVRLGRSTR
jgi:hypothetical protein